MQTILLLNRDLSYQILNQKKCGLIFEVNRTGNISRTYIQKVIKTENYIYLELGETGEKYIFKNIENKKYIMYMYDYISGKYLTPKTSFLVSHEMKKGNFTENTIAMSEEKVIQYLQRISPFNNARGIENIELESIDYETRDKNTIKFAGRYVFVSQNQELEIYIDQHTGLWKNGTYQSSMNYRIEDKREFKGKTMDLDEIVIPKYELLESSDIAQNIKSGVSKVLKIFEK